MKKVLMGCYSEITRNNGITRYIIEATQLMRRSGYVVDFVTDNPTIVDINFEFDMVHRPNDVIEYPDMIKDGLPHFTYHRPVVDRIKQQIRSIADDYDMYIAHDLYSLEAMLETKKNVFSCVHTSALIDGINYTFLDDDLIERERQAMLSSTIIIQVPEMTELFPNAHTKLVGLPMNNPSPFVRGEDVVPEGVLFLGEGTFRKGADRYVEAMLKTNLPARIVTSSLPEFTFEELENAEHVRFGVDQVDEKGAFVSGSKMMYFPSRSETFSYSVVETLLSQPVLLNDHPWAHYLEPYGATVLGPNEDAARKIQEMYKDADTYKNLPIVQYLSESKKRWMTL